MADRRAKRRSRSIAKRALVLSLLPVVLAASACGGAKKTGGSAQGTTTPATQTSATQGVGQLTVHESEFKLDPAKLAVSKPGTYTVQIVNQGMLTHAFAVEGNGIDKDSQSIEPGSTLTFRVHLPTTGTYQIYCPVDGHKNKGMRGVLTVGGSSGGAGTSTATTTTGTSTGTSTSGGYGY